MFNFDLKYDRPEIQSAPSDQMVEKLLYSWKPNLAVKSIIHLTGGYSNSNFSVKTDKGHYVLRISEKGQEVLEIEKSLSKKLQHTGITPEILYVGGFSGQSFSIAKFEEGELFSESWQGLSQGVLEEILIDLGEKLSIIHNVQFPQAGFFNADLSIGNEFADGVGTGYYDYIISALESEQVASRLEVHVLKELKTLVNKSKKDFEDLNFHQRLVHSDFNTKNILILESDMKVSTILDWEFSHAGTPLNDWANILRFENEVQFNVSELLRKNYQCTLNLFTENWRKKCYLLDLSSMVSFLSRDKVGPNTHETVKKVIQKTLDILE